MQRRCRNNEKGITEHRLGRELKKYSIKSCQRRHGGPNSECGYLRIEIEKVLSRYIPPENDDQSLTPAADQVS